MIEASDIFTQPSKFMNPVRSLFLVATSTAAIAIAFPVKAVVIFDNTNNLNPTIDGGWLIYDAGSSDGAGGTNNVDLSQGFQFTTTAGGDLSQIDVYLDRSDGAGAINFNLYADNANAPNLSNSLANFSFTPSSPTAASAPYTAIFGSGTNLVANTAYWLIASVEPGSINNFGWNFTTSDPNRPRYQFFDFGVGVTGSNLDTSEGGLFRVSVTNSSTAVPEPFTIIGTIVGGTAALRLRKKLTKK